MPDLSDILAHYIDLPAGRGQFAQKQADQRGLPGAAVADNEDKFPFLYA